MKQKTPTEVTGEIREFCEKFLSRDGRQSFCRAAPDPVRAQSVWGRESWNMKERILPLLDRFEKDVEDPGVIPLEKQESAERILGDFLKIFRRLKKEYSLQEDILDFLGRREEELDVDSGVMSELQMLSKEEPDGL